MNKSDMNVKDRNIQSGKSCCLPLPIMWGNLFQQLYNIVDSLDCWYLLAKMLLPVSLQEVSSSRWLDCSAVFLIGAGVVISGFYGAKTIKHGHSHSYLGLPLH